MLRLFTLVAKAKRGEIHSPIPSPIRAEQLDFGIAPATGWLPSIFAWIHGAAGGLGSGSPSRHGLVLGCFPGSCVAFTGVQVGFGALRLVLVPGLRE